MFFIIEIPEVVDLLAVASHYYAPDDPAPISPTVLFKRADAILCTALCNIDEEHECDDYPPSVLLAAEYVIGATRALLNTDSIGGFTIIDDAGSVSIEL